jgi:hypothetical protein
MDLFNGAGTQQLAMRKDKPATRSAALPGNVTNSKGKRLERSLVKTLVVAG